MSERDGTEGLQAELVGESALSLGRAGARLQAALDALATHDAASGGRGEVRDALIDDAAERAWEFVVTRGAMGWNDEQVALEAYGVPAEVRLRMGATRRG